MHNTVSEHVLIRLCVSGSILAKAILPLRNHHGSLASHSNVGSLQQYKSQYKGCALPSCTAAFEQAPEDYKRECHAGNDPAQDLLFMEALQLLTALGMNIITTYLPR